MNPDRRETWCSCTGTILVSNNQMCGSCGKPLKSLASNHELLVAENMALKAENKAFKDALETSPPCEKHRNSTLSSKCPNCMESEIKSLALEVVGLREALEAARTLIGQFRLKEYPTTQEAWEKIESALATPSTIAKQVEARIRAEQRERDAKIAETLDASNRDNERSARTHAIEIASAIRNQGEGHE